MADYNFTARAVVDITGVPYPVLVDLQKRGVVTPSKVRGVGTGHNSVYDTADVFAVATLQRFRPKAETTEHLRALFKFWHSKEGLALVHGARGGVVVMDGHGHVALEQETDVVKLAALRKSATLLVIEPASLAVDIYADIGDGTMLGRHVAPLPSGRLPRPSRGTAPTRRRENAHLGAERTRSKNQAKKKAARRK